MRSFDGQPILTESSETLAGVRVPHGGLVIFSSGEYQITIGVELNSCDRSLVPLEQDRLLNNKNRLETAFRRNGNQFSLTN